MWIHYVKPYFKRIVFAIDCDRCKISLISFTCAVTLLLCFLVLITYL